MFRGRNDLFNEELKKQYAYLAAVLGCTVTQQWKRAYLGVRKEKATGKLKAIVYFLSEDGAYINPAEEAAAPQLIKIIGDNMRFLADGTQKIFDMFKRRRQNFFMMFFTVGRQGEFETEFHYRKNFPMNAPEELYPIYFKYRAGIPIDSGGEEWAILSEYLNSEHYKKRNKKIIKSEEK